MRVALPTGEVAIVAGKPKPTNKQLDRAVSLSIVRLRLNGYTFAAIAEFHGIHESTAKRRFDSTPDHAKQRAYVTPVG